MKTEELPLLVDKRKGMFFYLGLPQCNICENDCKELIHIFCEWGSKESRVTICCDSNTCILKAGRQKIPSADVFEKKEALIINKKKEGMEVHFIRPPGMGYAKDMNVYEVAQIETPETEDKTVHAGRESLEGSKVGDDSYITNEDKKGDVDNLLVEVKQSKPLIEEEDKDKLEHKEE